MAAGRKRKGRPFDDIAVGFLQEIGGNLQSAIAGIAIAATAIEDRKSDLGPKFVKLVKAGRVLEPLGRGTFFHNPNANSFDVRVSQ